MTRSRTLQVAGGLVLLGLFAWGVGAVLERMMRPEVPVETAAPEPPAAEGVPRITATLYYGAADGQGLVAVQREVPLATGGAVPQGRTILAALLEPAPEPHVSLIPAGTTLRAFYVTERGDAFVDLSRDVATGHSGGSFAELLTIYSIVNSVTANLSGVQRVQILIDGREVDTLAGHVDLRRPLTRDLSLVVSNQPDN